MVTKEKRKDGGEDVRGEEGNGVADARAAKLEVLETTDAKNFKIRVCRDTWVSERSEEGKCATHHLHQTDRTAQR